MAIFSYIAVVMRALLLLWPMVLVIASCKGREDAGPAPSTGVTVWKQCLEIYPGDSYVVSTAQDSASLTVIGLMNAYRRFADGKSFLDDFMGHGHNYGDVLYYEVAANSGIFAFYDSRNERVLMDDLQSNPGYFQTRISLPELFDSGSRPFPSYPGRPFAAISPASAGRNGRYYFFMPVITGGPQPAYYMARFLKNGRENALEWLVAEMLPPEERFTHWSTLGSDYANGYFYFGSTIGSYRVDTFGIAAKANLPADAEYLLNVTHINGDTLVAIALTPPKRLLCISIDNGRSFQLLTDQWQLSGKIHRIAPGKMLTWTKDRIFTLRLSASRYHLTQHAKASMPNLDIVSVNRHRDTVFCITKGGVYKKAYSDFIRDTIPTP